MRRDRAQSSTIGVILLTAVVVITVSSIGFFWIGSLSERADATGPLIETNVTATDSNVTIRHVMGESVGVEEISVIVRNDTTTQRFTLGAGAVPPDDDRDGRFEPSESRTIAHGLGNSSIEVVVIHEPSNSVIHREYVEISP